MKKNSFDYKNEMNEEKTLTIYQADDGEIEIPVTLEEDTLWLAQKDIANIFGVNVPAISKHIDNIFHEGELQKKATVSKMEIVQTEGKR